MPKTTELHGPVKRACGHTTYRAGDVVTVTPELLHWFKVQDCESCRMKPGWEPSASQAAASKAVRESRKG